MCVCVGGSYTPQTNKQIEKQEPTNKEQDRLVSFGVVEAELVRHLTQVGAQECLVRTKDKGHQIICDVRHPGYRLVGGCVVGG